MWFAFVTSPLGGNVRVSKSFIIGYGQDKGDGELLDKLKHLFKVDVLSGRSVEERMLLVSLDPDAADLVNCGAEDFIVTQIE